MTESQTTKTEETLEFERTKHISNIAWYELLLIPFSAILFITDIGTDWYLASSYLHISHVQNRNYLGYILDERILNDKGLNETHNFYNKLCHSAFDDQERNGRFYLQPELRKLVDINTLTNILNQSYHDEKVLYKFLQDVFIQDSTLFQDVTYLWYLYDVNIYDSKNIKNGSVRRRGDFEYNFLCNSYLTNTNLSEMLHNLWKFYEKPKNCSTGIPDYGQSFFHKQLCNKVSYSRKLFDRMLYDYSTNNLKSVLQYTNDISKHIFVNKVLFDRNLYENLVSDTRKVYGGKILALYELFNVKFKNLSPQEKEIIRDTYERFYWYMTYGALTAIVVLIATVANVIVKLWKDYKWCPIHWLWLPFYKLLNLQVLHMNLVNWLRAFKYLELRSFSFTDEGKQLSIQKKHSLLRKFQDTYYILTAVKNTEARTEALPQFTLQLYIAVATEFQEGWVQWLSIFTSIGSFAITMYTDRKANNIKNKQKESYFGYGLYATGRALPIGCRMLSVVFAFHASVMLARKLIFWWLLLPIVCFHYILSTCWMWRTKSNNDNLFLSAVVWLIEPLVTVHDHYVSIGRAVGWSLLYTAECAAFLALWFIEDTSYHSIGKIATVSTLLVIDIVGRTIFCLYWRFRFKFIVKFKDEAIELDEPVYFLAQGGKTGLETYSVQKNLDGVD